MPEVRKELKLCEAKTVEPSIDEPPEVELKELPPHLEYAFLEGDNKLPIPIDPKDQEKNNFTWPIRNLLLIVACLLRSMQCSGHIPKDTLLHVPNPFGKDVEAEWTTHNCLNWEKRAFHTDRTLRQDSCGRILLPQNLTLKFEDKKGAENLAEIIVQLEIPIKTNSRTRENK
ncbi:hypothetical protein Tco_0199228 [Tanacetum coccineum]